MPTLILLRHGQSVFNQADLFTGWVDVPLSKKGIQEALTAGQAIADLPIQSIFTSTLIRAQQTALLAMSEHKSKKMPVLIHEEDSHLALWGHIHSEQTQKKCIPVMTDWRLNERYYGDLQGQNKQEAREEFGEEQVHIWRRSFDIPPPDGESLKMTAERTIPCFKERILPLLLNQSVFVCAHGNSLRSIVMEIEGLSEEEVLHLEIATGEPLLYDYENHQFRRLK